LTLKCDILVSNFNFKFNVLYRYYAEANQAFGWVVEMWAYSIASAQAGVEYNLHPEMMLQPPWDATFQLAGGGCTSAPKAPGFKPSNLKLVGVRIHARRVVKGVNPLFSCRLAPLYCDISWFQSLLSQMQRVYRYAPARTRTSSTTPTATTSTTPVGGLYQSNPVVTHSLKAPGCNP
jgi:hypothetical protein